MTAEETTTSPGEAAAAAVDWELMERWDRAYYLHVMGAGAESTWRAVTHQEGCWLYMADGSRLLDFQSQLTSDHMGHRHPRVVEGLRQALDRYGHVYFAMATDFRARAAKLIIRTCSGRTTGRAGCGSFPRVRTPSRRHCPWRGSRPAVRS